MEKNRKRNRKNLYSKAIFFVIVFIFPFLAEKRALAIEWYENFDDANYLDHFNISRGQLYNNVPTNPDNYSPRTGNGYFYKVYTTTALSAGQTTPYFFGLNSSNDLGRRYKFDLFIGPEGGSPRHDTKNFKLVQFGDSYENTLYLRKIETSDVGPFYQTNLGDGTVNLTATQISSPTLRLEIGNGDKFLISNTDLSPYQGQWITVEIEAVCYPTTPYYLKVWINGTLDFYRSYGTILQSCWPSHRYFGSFGDFSNIGTFAYLGIDNFYKFDTARPSDSTPPSLLNGYPTSNVPSGSSQTEIGLETDEYAVCRYSTTPLTAYDSMTNYFSSSGMLSHKTTITGLSPGATYHFFVRCRDEVGNFNTDDYQISFTVDSVTDVYPPERFGGYPVEGTHYPSGTTALTMSLSTNESAECRFSELSGISFSAMTPIFTATNGVYHSYDLAGLQDGLTYIYYVRCQDTSSNPNINDYLISFAIDADALPPLRNYISPESELPSGTTQADLIIETDEPAVCKYSTSSQDFASMTQTFSGGGTTTHTVRLSSLIDGGSYTYYIRCKDALLNVNTDDYLVSFSVLQEAVPPVISGGSPSGTLSAGTASATLAVNTNESATCRYSTSSGIGYDSLTHTFTTTGGTSHSQGVSVQSGASYAYYIRCSDSLGNSTTSDYLIQFSVASATNSVGNGSGSTPTTDNSVSLDITKPSSGTTISTEEYTFKAEAKNADSVDFYYQKSGSDEKFFIDDDNAASDGDVFSITVDVRDVFDNGDYTLIAKGKNDDSDDSDKTSFTVDLSSITVQTTVAAEVPVIVDSTATGSTAPAALINQNISTGSLVSLDSDQDGISDEEEARLGTSLNSSDSDGDGVSDEKEILSGTDPLKKSSDLGGDKIDFEDVKEKGTKSKLLKIEKVYIPENKKASGQLRLEGLAEPNTFVTLYIYSEKPVIVTVKTDANGGWALDLDKNIDDGEHEAYVAITDRTGKVYQKSEPIAFVKTAQAVNIVPYFESSSPESLGASPIEKSKKPTMVYFLIASGIFLLLALVVIGMLIKKKENISG